MLAVVGTLLLSAALFVFAWARVEHQRARPARWVRYEIASQLVVFLILMLMSAGGGLILHVAGNYDSNPIGFVEGGAIAAIVVATLFLFAIYRRRGRALPAEPVTAMGPASVVAGPGMSGLEHDPGPPDSRTPGGKRRRAA